MRSIEVSGRLAALTLVVVVVLSLVAAPVAADHNDGDNEGASGPTTTVTESTTDDSSSSSSSTSTSTSASENDSETSVVQRVDEFLVVRDYRYDAGNETFYVTLENTASSGSGISSSVTITEAIPRKSAGASTFGVVTGSIEPGDRVTLSLSASRIDGAAAVYITSQRSLQNKQGVYLQESKKGGGGGLIKAPPSGAQVRSAAIFSGFGSLGIAILTAWQHRVSRNEDVRDVIIDPKERLRRLFKRD